MNNRIPVMKPTTCCILAGGLGTRLRPLVKDRPKCLALINGKPFLDILIEWLAERGIGHIVFCLGYKSDLVRDHLRNVKYSKLKYSCVVEGRPMGTGGALKLAESKINENNFYAMNGDTFLPDISLDDLAHEHNNFKKNKSEHLVTIAVSHRDAAGTQGICMDPHTRLVQTFGGGEFASELGNAGLYMMERDIFKLIPPSQTWSLENDTFRLLASQGNRMGVFTYKGFMGDMGTPDGLKRLEQFLETQERTPK